MPQTADYPKATWIPAHPSTFRAGKPNRPVDLIVIHITDGGPKAENTAKYFGSGSEGRKASAHFVIGQQGEIFQCVRLNDVAHHAGSANSKSIGIEHCARTPKELGKNDPGLPLAQVQLAVSAELVAWLCAMYKLPLDRVHIKGHCEADTNTTHKDCPNAIWKWDDYMKLLQAVPQVCI